MGNFRINFTHPWLLLLLVAAVLLTMIPHLRIAKKYRRNRNRITSLVLHMIVLVLSILVLSGISFDYTQKNDKNEIILLVDVSDSSIKYEEERDEVVETILDFGKYDGYKIGIVTFGFDQEYAVPFTNDVSSIYSRYKAAELPDTTATDIAAALNYTKALFTNLETSKIVLITDAKETDENAMNAIRAVSANGTKVDICYVTESEANADVQVYDIVQPNTHISVENEVEFTFKAKSTAEQEVDFEIWDNGIRKDLVSLKLIEGTGTYSFKHVFSETGMHELKVVAVGINDEVTENDAYLTYVNIETFNKLLVIEGYDGQSDALESLLTNKDEYEVTVVGPDEFDTLPTTIHDLRKFDQVILNNIANEDLPTNIVPGAEKQVDFVDVLYEYVNVYGGGLLTVGGLDETGEKAHAYNRQDMVDTKLQEMLPVEAINYKPPVGIMIVVDVSGSMSDDAGNGKTFLEAAIKGCQTLLEGQILSERDMVGVMTLTSYEEQRVVLGLTPRTKEAKIREAIESLIDEPGGGTDFYPAIDKAAQLLRAQTNLAYKHIVVISDGGAGDQAGESGYQIFAELCNKIAIEDNIVTDIFTLGNTYDDGNKDSCIAACEGYGDNAGLLKGSAVFLGNKSVESIGSELKEIFTSKEVTEVMNEDFKASVANEFDFKNIFANVDLEVSPYDNTTKTLPFEFSKFIGVKVKSSDYLVLKGEYNVPIYAQWKFGEGTVGSLMVALDNVMAPELLDPNSEGSTLLKNIINELMPIRNIHSSEIEVNLREDNYINQISVYTTLEEGERLEGKITNLSDDSAEVVSLNNLPEEGTSLRNLSTYVTLAMTENNDYSRANFIIKEPGIYSIEITKYNSAGEKVGDSTTVYKDLAYSKEYDTNLLANDFNIEEYLEKLAERGKGAVIEDNEDPHEIFDTFVPIINKSFDPRILFMIIAIVLFLTDIAVRKFKFKWPHELIREYKKKKEESKK